MRAERTQPDARATAREYIGRGWCPIPVPRASKNPGRDNWPQERYSPDDVDAAFDPAGNIGLLLGKASGGLADVDLDAPEAIAAAPYLLPATDMRHGRPSKLRSHWWYRTTDGEMHTTRYRDPDGSTLAELRGTGAQTIVPPSVHPSGELLSWESDGEPACVKTEALHRAVAHVAACAMVAKRWPQGSRHDVALALAGLLCRGGIEEQDAMHVVEVVAHVAGDAEWRDRVRAVRDTYADTGPRTGGPRLAELLPDGDQVVGKLRDLLDLRAGDADVERRALHVYQIEDLLALELPRREYLYQPVLQRQGIMLLHAFRGTGKTYFGLWWLYLLSSGAPFLKWTAPTPRRVLLLDGEMPGAALQERLAQLVRSSAVQPPRGYFRVIVADLQPRGVASLATPGGQDALEPYLEGVDLIWVDNISTLCRSTLTGVENDAESWAPLQEWALKLRRRGIASCFVHHDSKAGGQRGTVAKEDVLDTVIALKRPPDYRASDGLRCEVHFEKNRGFYGEDAEPFEVAYVTDDSGRGQWVMTALDDKMTERVAALLRDQCTYRAIRSELGIGLATINRHRRKAIDRGLIDG